MTNQNRQWTEFYQPAFRDFYLNIELIGDVKAPQRADNEAAGIDFFSPIDITIPPRGDALVPLNIKYEMPRGFAIIAMEKSGVATKKKLDLGACVGDSNYRGIFHAHLINNSDTPQSFAKGDKIIQGVVVPVWVGEFKIVSSVDNNTVRGEGGFGSTGTR